MRIHLLIFLCWLLLESAAYGANLDLVHATNASKALSKAIEYAKPGSVEFTLTRNAKPFIFSGCSNGCGCDVCSYVLQRGYFAPVETMIFDWLLGMGICDTGEIVVDVGANAGYFTNIAASYGCNVLAFEPNPLPASLLRLTTITNGFAPQVHVFPFALGRSASLGVMQQTMSWGTQHVDPYGSGFFTDSHKLQIMPLQDFVRQNISILKIDTEGYESHVLAGSWAALRTVAIRNVVIEVKNVHTKEKRDVLAELMRSACLPYAYNYKEDYLTVDPLKTMSLTQRFVDVSDIIANERFTEPLLYEDFWLRAEPLPRQMVLELE